MVAPRILPIFFFSSRRRHTRLQCYWSSDVCSSDLECSGPTRPSTPTPSPPPPCPPQSPATPTPESPECRPPETRTSTTTPAPPTPPSPPTPCRPPRSEDSLVGKEVRSRWRTYHNNK